MTNLNKDLVKAQIPLIQEAITKHLKVDAGKQAAYHIFSVAHFFKNDNQMKASFEKSHYSIHSNFGTVDFPCMITHDIGMFDSEHQAYYEAEAFLKACKKNITWELVKDNKGTGKLIQSRNNPERGLSLSIEIRGEKQSDIEHHLDDVKDQIQSGLRGNGGGSETDSFEFNIYGEEYDVFNDIDCFVDDNTYAIFDAKGVIESSDEEDDILAIWKESDKEIEEWTEFLVHGENVELDYALQNDEEVYYALSRQSGTFYSGQIVDILDSLKDETAEFSLFLALETKY